MTPAHRIDRRTPVPGGRTGNGVSGENQNGTDKESQAKVLHWLLNVGGGGTARPVWKMAGKFGRWVGLDFAASWWDAFKRVWSESV